MKIKMIACEVMKEELLSIPPVHEMDFSFIPMGLHLHPDKLNIELQRQLDESYGYTHILLGFGLCGGAARTLVSNNAILIIPKVHDCVPLLLGSNQLFGRFHNDELGTLYYSCGWFRGENSFFPEYEKLSAKYGESEALEVMQMMYDSYKKFLFIQTGHPDESTCLEKSREIARILDLKFGTVQGKKDYFIKLVQGPWDQDEFIILQPGQQLNDSLFHGM